MTRSLVQAANREAGRDVMALSLRPTVASVPVANANKPAGKVVNAHLLMDLQYIHTYIGQSRAAKDHKQPRAFTAIL
jgi:hypothetical protein